MKASVWISREQASDIQNAYPAMAGFRLNRPPLDHPSAGALVAQKGREVAPFAPWTRLR